MPIKARIDTRFELRERHEIAPDLVELKPLTENRFVVSRFARTFRLAALLLRAVFLVSSITSFTLVARGNLGAGQVAVVVSAAIVILAHLVPQLYRAGRLRSRIEFAIPIVTTHENRPDSMLVSEDAG